MFNPAKASSNIKEEFIDYIATTHAFANASLQEQFVKELRANIARGPLLEITDVFKSGKSIEEMIEDADCPLSPLFRELEAGKPSDKLHKHKLPLTRNLYLHQEKAIRAIVGGNNAVVLNELARYNSTTSLTALGQIQFEYKGNSPEIVQGIANDYNADPVSVKALLDLLIFEIVKIGAIYSDIDEISRKLVRTV